MRRLDCGMGTDQRTVTILTSDLQGSTSLGERLDPESLREVISHYFDAMVAVIEAHGGTVEKFSGDAILAIFESVDAPGSPADPATAARRAVQAAAETQRTLAALNERLDATWGVRLTNRTGVATGELVVGAASHSEHILSGGVVGLATALEQAAPANDVLIDTATLVRVSDQAIVEQVPSVRIKGREDDAAAYHVLSVASLDLADVSPDTDAQAAHVLDSRKTVTIVFADIHPTASDESALDPAVVRDVMALVFEVAQSALLGHGGTVEKYIGDAVMAVFGLPVRHEDDALRAVRAASDLRDALRRLVLTELDATGPFGSTSRSA